MPDERESEEFEDEIRRLRHELMNVRVVTAALVRRLGGSVSLTKRELAELDYNVLETQPDLTRDTLHLRLIDLSGKESLSA